MVILTRFKGKIKGKMEGFTGIMSTMQTEGQIFAVGEIPQYRQFLERTSFGSLMKRAANLLTQRLTAGLEPYDLTASQWVVLACLWRQDGQPVTYISRQVQQIGGTISGVLDRMEKRKLVRRKRDASDRRVYRVFLTEKGANLINELPQVARSLWDTALEKITPEEKEQFSDYINHCLKNLIPGYTCSLPECKNELSPNLSKILPPKSLGYRMKLLSMVMTQVFNERLEPHNVTNTQWVVLCRLWLAEGITTMEIGKYVDQVGGTLTGLLERMEDRKLIRRDVDQQDKRRILVYLTDEGRQLYWVLPEITLAVMGETYAGLDQEQVDFMTEVLRKIVDALDIG